MTFVHFLRRCRPLAHSAVLPAVLLAVGCRSTSQATFVVNLRNASDQPVTVWLTKDGGPEEAEWLAPEALVTSGRVKLDSISGVTVPAGRSAEIGPIAGKFDADSVAVLRVYAGQLRYDQLLATPSDGKLRVDVSLREGTNRLVVSPSLPLRVDRDGDPATRPSRP